MDKTKLGMKIAVTVILTALVQGAITLYRTRVLIVTYGAEVNGVIQVALQMSAYLTLIQNGMSAAYQFNMYSPLEKGAFDKISALFMGLRVNMRRISMKLLVISAGVLPLYTLLINNKSISYVDTILILAIISIRLIAPYFVTLPERCMIDIKEKKYIVIFVEGAKDSFTLGVEIVLILFTPLPLPVILSFYLVWLLVTRIIYIRIIKKLYGSSLDWQTSPDFSPSGMTKDVLAHQIASIATSNTDNVTLSIFNTLTNVTVFSAFNTLIMYPSLVLNRIITGMRVSLALKITKGDENSYSAFRELLAFSMLWVCITVPVFLLLANKFVALWIGPQYQISLLSLILFAAILADAFIMPPVYAARDAKGLYRESKGYAIGQAVVNVVFSVALVIPFGINGVLLGTFAAAYFVLQPFNFRLVYSKVFARKQTIYLDLAIVFALCAVSYFSAKLLLSVLFVAADIAWSTFVVQALLCTAVSVLIAGAGLWAFNNHFRLLIKRFAGLFSGRTRSGSKTL